MRISRTVAKNTLAITLFVIAMGIWSLYGVFSCNSTYNYIGGGKYATEMTPTNCSVTPKYSCSVHDSKNKCIQYSDEIIGYSVVCNYQSCNIVIGSAAANSSNVSNVNLYKNLVNIYKCELYQCNNKDIISFSAVTVVVIVLAFCAIALVIDILTNICYPETTYAPNWGNVDPDKYVESQL